MLFNIVLAIVAIVVGVCVIVAIVVAMQPAEFRLARKGTFAAPPAEVFQHVNDFHQWRAWSPWERLDPQLKRTYEGPSAGTGAVYSWVGNKQVGEGRMTIVESRSNELIRIKLEFFRPMQATNETDFTFQPQGNETVVTWSMTGRNNFMGKAFHLLMDIDKIVGKQFDEGLANLKAVVEGPGTFSQPVASARAAS